MPSPSRTPLAGTVGLQKVDYICGDYAGEVGDSTDQLEHPVEPSDGKAQPAHSCLEQTACLNPPIRNGVNQCWIESG